jgi:hypothetical protein
LGKEMRRLIELRLAAVEEWRRKRFERTLERGDQAAALKAAQLYTEVSSKAASLALAAVTRYRDFD